LFRIYIYIYISDNILIKILFYKKVKGIERQSWKQKGLPCKLPMDRQRERVCA